jgi:hypothetical protein
VFGPKLKVRVKLSDRLSKGLRASDDLAYCCLVVRLQQAFEGSGKGGHGVQWDVVPVNPL